MQRESRLPPSHMPHTPMSHPVAPAPRHTHAHSLPHTQHMPLPSSSSQDTETSETGKASVKGMKPRTEPLGSGRRWRRRETERKALQSQPGGDEPGTLSVVTRLGAGPQQAEMLLKSWLGGGVGGTGSEEVKETEVCGTERKQVGSGQRGLEQAVLPSVGGEGGLGGPAR